MKNTLESLISRLKEIDHNTQPLEFDQVLCQIGELNQINSITELVNFFDDNAEYDEVMFSIIHIIESFDIDIYIEKLIEFTPNLYKFSPRWNAILLMRVLNSESAKSKLIHQLMEAHPRIKSDFRNLIHDINDASPNFLSKTLSVLAILI